MPAPRPVKLAVTGAGLIGARHIAHILAAPEAELVAIVDPSPAAREMADEADAPWFADIAAMLAAAKPEGVIVATPNRLHVPDGLEVVAAGIPVLIEKPIADDVASAHALVEAAEKACVPLLVGHHRRHNPMIRKAKEIIDSGRLGRIVCVHGFFWLMKPDGYFDVAWRREAGAGPILVNAIHDIDLLRFLAGEIASVQAMSSNAVRGHAVEETATILLRFASGALGSLAVSDTVVAPWSWEHTTGENPAYPETDQSCYHFAGTHASLTVPRLEVWTNPGARSWLEPFSAERIMAPKQDPLRLQIQHFARIIRGAERPLVSGREGLNTLKVIEAVKQAVRDGGEIRIS